MTTRRRVKWGSLAGLVLTCLALAAAWAGCSNGESSETGTLPSGPRVVERTAPLSGSFANDNNGGARTAINIVVPRRTPTDVQFTAMPSAECTAYTPGLAAGAPALATNQDGVGHIRVQPTDNSADAFALNLDCTNNAGATGTYVLQFSLGEAYAAPPLPASTITYNTRPPLAGDPMSYSQNQLTEAGYPPRPDANSSMYAKWLSIVSVPVKMAVSPIGVNSTRSATTHSVNYAGAAEGHPDDAGTPSQYDNVTADYVDRQATWAGSNLNVWEIIEPWTGMDMDKSDGIQAGTISNVKFTGSEYYWTTYAWWESLSDPNHPNQIVDITDWYPSWTDEIYVSVYSCTLNTNDIAWTGSLWGCFYVEDVTASTGNYYYGHISGNSFEGHSIWWIQERTGTGTGECDGANTETLEEMPTFTSYGMAIYAQGGGYGDPTLWTMTVDGTSGGTTLVSSEYVSSTPQVNLDFDHNGAEYCWHYE